MFCFTVKQAVIKSNFHMSERIRGVPEIEPAPAGVVLLLLPKLIIKKIRDVILTLIISISF